MSSKVSPLRHLAASFFAVILLSAAAAAQTAPQPDLSQVDIKNFGRMDDRFFRGAEPKTLEDFAALKSLGIDTIIDLQAKPEPAEKGWVESLGMRYVNIPMIEKKYPRPEHVEAFIKTVDDPVTGKFYVHCAGGRHRTGAMGAVYRYEKYGWNYDQVYAEMKKFDFYTAWGHGAFKDFVKDYFAQVQARATAPAAKTDAEAEGALSGSRR
ncbi:MAG TPA: tyrosine-protein phosphatase [Pyrinomonadaceae bacterium]|nr:tyrosine-protein phosphatase [Pyrinomonadaceae bacterium]